MPPGVSSAAQVSQAVAPSSKATRSLVDFGSLDQWRCACRDRRARPTRRGSRHRDSAQARQEALINAARNACAKVVIIATRVEAEALAGMEKAKGTPRPGRGRKGGNTLLPAFKVKTHKVVRRRVCFWPDSRHRRRRAVRQTLTQLGHGEPLGRTR